jgi:hypothetical protein
MKFSIIGIVIPLVVLLFSYFVSDLLFRHFAGK